MNFTMYFLKAWDMSLWVGESEEVGKMKKFRIDVYAKWNTDMLISRNYVCFMTEAEAYEYGNSIANGNIVNVMEANWSYC